MINSTSNGPTMVLGLVFALFCVTSIHSQSYSGQAYAVSSTVTVTGQPVVTNTVADTGDLPMAGGNITLNSVGVNLPGGLVSIGSSTTSTSGSPVGGGTTQSSANLNNLHIGIAGAVITASVVSSTASCACPASTPSGSSSLTNLVIAGTPITVTGETNQKIILSLTGSRTLTVVINQHVSSPRSITVNALSVTLQDPLASTATRVIVASSRSGINCILPPTANLFAGRGTGVRVRQSSALTGYNGTIVADTGPLPTEGDALTFTTIGAGLPPLLSTGVATANSSGGILGGTPNSTQSDASVNDLAVTVANPIPILPPVLALTASAVQSNTQCQCTLGTPTCTAGSSLAGLNVAISGVNIPIVITGLPNQIVNLTVPGGLGNITLVINERVNLGPGDLTINALRIQLDLLPSVLIATDVAVSRSHSSIVCGLAPTAAQASVSGRVILQDGRPLRNAIVTLTGVDSDATRATRTSAFGSFIFDGVEVGRTYIVSVNSKDFTVTPQIVSVVDEITNIELIAIQN